MAWQGYAHELKIKVKLDIVDLDTTKILVESARLKYS